MQPLQVMRIKKKKKKSLESQATHDLRHVENILHFSATWETFQNSYRNRLFLMRGEITLYFVYSFDADGVICQRIRYHQGTFKAYIHDAIFSASD